VTEGTWDAGDGAIDGFVGDDNMEGEGILDTFSGCVRGTVLMVGFGD